MRLLCSLASAASILVPPTLAAAAPALIERAKLFGNPARIQARLSPDGQWLAWLAPRDDVQNIWIAPVSNPADAKPLTLETVRPIRQYYWAPDSRQILFLNDKGGDGNLILYSADLATGGQRALTPLAKTRAQIVAISPAVKGRILVGLNDRDPRWNDVYSLDLATGQRSLVMRSDDIPELNFVVDRQLNVRGAAKIGRDGGLDYYRVVDGKIAAQPFSTIGLDDYYGTHPLSFTDDGKTLYWADSRGRNTAALVAQDMATGRKVILARDARADIDTILTSARTGKIQAYAVNYERNDWIATDPAYRADIAWLKAKLGRDVDISSRSDEDRSWTVTIDPVTAPASTYLFERRSKRLTKLFTSYPELVGAPLVAMHPREITARDGLKLVSYLSLPPGSDIDGDGRPEKAVPMVLWVHGGPWSRDRYGYSAVHQWLANRGYAVLSVNFRSSLGFGKKSIASANLQWGRRMHDDLVDAVQWAVKRGVTRADKVAIAGVSYGGYSTLVGVTFTPDTFRCGVDIVGPSNLYTLLQTYAPYGVSTRIQFYRRMGDPTTAMGKAMLLDRSPLLKVNNIKVPLLIGQGVNDPIVNVREADQIAAAMKKANIPVTYVVFPDEGHGFMRPQNNIAFNAIAENFLQSCLGGRAEPIGDALKASTATIRQGAEFVSGLPAAAAR
jgi:dipeptidyl aminopeptidase/acylaminoacyl peptidase